MKNIETRKQPMKFWKHVYLQRIMPRHFLMNVAGGHTVTSFRIENPPICRDWVALEKLIEGFPISEWKN